MGDQLLSLEGYKHQLKQMKMSELYKELGYHKRQFTHIYQSNDVLYKNQKFFDHHKRYGSAVILEIKTRRYVEKAGRVLRILLTPNEKTYIFSYYKEMIRAKDYLQNKPS